MLRLHVYSVRTVDDHSLPILRISFVITYLRCRTREVSLGARDFHFYDGRYRSPDTSLSIYKNLSRYVYFIKDECFCPDNASNFGLWIPGVVKNKNFCTGTRTLFLPKCWHRHSWTFPSVLIHNFRGNDTGIPPIAHTSSPPADLDPDNHPAVLVAKRDIYVSLGEQDARHDRDRIATPGPREFQPKALGGPI